jgi:hypothetical protein
MIDRPEITFSEKGHSYTLDGVTVPSVTTVTKLGAVDPFSIGAAWGFKLGAVGAVETAAEDLSALSSYERLRDVLKERGATPWSQRDKAAERGTNVHSALEAIAQDGAKIDPLDYPENERGYVRGVLRWISEAKDLYGSEPEFEAVEVIVGSRTHGFAGRYDLRARIGGELAIVDLKTSKGLYPAEHFPQVAAYELASVEIGYPPTDAQFVLRVSAAGNYWLHRSTATGADFLAYLEAWKAREGVIARHKEAG